MSSDPRFPIFDRRSREMNLSFQATLDGTNISGSGSIIGPVEPTRRLPDIFLHSNAQRRDLRVFSTDARVADSASRLKDDRSCGEKLFIGDNDDSSKTESMLDAEVTMFKRTLHGEHVRSKPG